MEKDEIPLEKKGDNTQTTPDYHGTGGPEEQMARGTHIKTRWNHANPQDTTPAQHGKPPESMKKKKKMERSKCHA